MKLKKLFEKKLLNFTQIRAVTKKPLKKWMRLTKFWKTKKNVNVTTNLGMPELVEILAVFLVEILSKDLMDFLDKMLILILAVDLVIFLMEFLAVVFRKIEVLKLKKAEMLK